MTGLAIRFVLLSCERTYNAETVTGLSGSITIKDGLADAETPAIWLAALRAKYDFDSDRQVSSYEFTLY